MEQLKKRIALNIAGYILPFLFSIVLFLLGFFYFNSLDLTLCGIGIFFFSLIPLFRLPNVIKSIKIKNRVRNKEIDGRKVIQLLYDLKNVDEIGRFVAKELDMPLLYGLTVLTLQVYKEARNNPYVFLIYNVNILMPVPSIFQTINMLSPKINLFKKVNIKYRDNKKSKQPGILYLMRNYLIIDNSFDAIRTDTILKGLSGVFGGLGFGLGLAFEIGKSSYTAFDVSNNEVEDEKKEYLKGKVTDLKIVWITLTDISEIYYVKQDNTVKITYFVADVSEDKELIINLKDTGNSVKTEQLFIDLIIASSVSGNFFFTETTSGNRRATTLNFPFSSNPNEIVDQFTIDFIKSCQFITDKNN